MNKPKGSRFTLLGLTLIMSAGGLALSLLAPCDARASEVLEEAKASHKLQSLAELDDKAPARRSLNVQTWNTAEGAKVLFVEAHELPMFNLRLTFGAGSSQDGKIPGLALLTNAMLNEGVAGKDVGAIAQGFEGLGADFGNGAYKDMAVASLRSLSAADKREPALKLFAEVVGKPTFPATSLARIKNQLLAGFEFQKQNPGKLASQDLSRRLYGDHPYSHASDGTAKSIPPITLAQLRAFHAKAYAAGNVVIALVGDLSRSEAQALTAQVSAALPKGPALAKIAPAHDPQPSTGHIEFPSKQTTILLAQMGIDRADPDFPALSLGNQILGGGGFGTRLMSEVREKRGLTYGIYSGFSPMQARGPFMINLQTRAEMSEGTRKLVEEVLADYLKSGPTQKELDDAKREMAGSFPLSNASNSDIVGQLGSMGFYDLPLNYLEDFMQQTQALTVEQVKAALNRHLGVDKMIVVTAGPTVPQKPLPPPTDKPVEQPLGVPEH
ncbi:M16 family metallopeptidase [Pseudomonas agarici]|uniref:M16 family metallopeptidase n=1 Tax=Pseudomonas agarici TaxID=46677 RepID=UPI00030FDE31|nr:pitrilysin family protein [Pseudomonas agarici]NWB91276.1 insulinase family protein [Pseudomonas agarici]NWC08043.1 insulinase family protein [Pseudomonas agarici]SEL17197.1 zinc protease [Pseudomonas agarici]